MAKKMKLRAFIGDNGVTVLKALLFHPMETGLRKDKKTGALIPAHFITEVKIEHNGKTVMTCLWGSAVSKNPFLSFDVSSTKAGDQLKVSWVDNQGGSDTAAVAIS